MIDVSGYTLDQLKHALPSYTLIKDLNQDQIEEAMVLYYSLPYKGYTPFAVKNDGKTGFNITEVITNIHIVTSYVPNVIIISEKDWESYCQLANDSPHLGVKKAMMSLNPSFKNTQDFIVTYNFELFDTETWDNPKQKTLQECFTKYSQSVQLLDKEQSCVKNIIE